MLCPGLGFTKFIMEIYLADLRAMIKLLLTLEFFNITQYSHVCKDEE